ncbi:MAG TPA: NAD-binding protein [Burkholderiales bacterium]|nr:NAD-binding protein [Burkholderiales bacterium]
MPRSGVFLFFRQLRRPLIFLIVVFAISTLGFTIIPGVDAQGKPAQMTFMEAFYVVSYTGSTIGFGELPFTFTGAQRLWMIFTIYVSVIVWLYSIGAIIATLQNAAFQRVIRERQFISYVRRMDMPFLIVCGYGDTGSLLVHELVRNYRVGAVVIDIDQERLDELGMEDLGVVIPAFCYDASQPEVLLNAGMTHPLCQGVVAVTGSNDVNLSVAMTVHLLNPRIPATCLANNADTAANMASFNTQNIINPFVAFAQRLGLTFRAPSALIIYDCLTSSYRTPMAPRLRPPQGRWIVCGYGRFGKAVCEKLIEAGNSVTVIEIDPEGTNAPLECIRGRGTEAPTLMEAGIMDAVGIVGGADDEINNLSAIVTARDLRPAIFTIGRQNTRRRSALFKAARLGMRVQTSYLTATEAVAVLRNPLLPDFLDVLKTSTESWAASLVDRLIRTVGDVSPEVWVIQITHDMAPAVWHSLEQGSPVYMGQLTSNPKDRNEQVSAVPLLLKRGAETVILPSNEVTLFKYDELLVCGRPEALQKISWIIRNIEVMRYIQTGVEQPGGWIWKWLARRRTTGG